MKKTQKCDHLIAQDLLQSQRKRKQYANADANDFAVFHCAAGRVTIFYIVLRQVVWVSLKVLFFDMPLVPSELCFLILCNDIPFHLC